MVAEIHPALLLAGGAGGGLLATLAMDRVMKRLPEGTTPPLIATGVLTKTTPDDAPTRLATVVHYFAGVGTGVLFVWLLLLGELLTSVGPGIESVGWIVLGVSPALFVLMVGFFAVIVLPRARDVTTHRTRQIRRDWAIAAGIYLFVLSTLTVLVV